MRSGKWTRTKTRAKMVVRCRCHSRGEDFAGLRSRRGTTVMRRMKETRSMTVRLSNAMGWGKGGKRGRNEAACVIVDVKGNQSLRGEARI